MRIIPKIAGAELRALFYSPIAWVITIIFFIACGVQFTSSLEALASQQHFNLDNTKGWKGFNFSITQGLFTEANAYMLSNLYLFIPLLTMGAISREVHSGTMQLLSSSPVKIRDIVIGKFLGLAIYNLVLIIPLALILAAGSLSIVRPEVMVFITTLLGIYLLTCTYTAIGLFVSALTNYQVVAALITFLFFVVMAVMPMLFQQYDIIRDITYFLNISGRVDSLLTGLITSRDILYFFLIIFLFLAFTYLKLKSKKESRPWWAHLSRYLAVFALVVTIGYISDRPSNIGYLDVTRDQINTIHPDVQKALGELKGESLQVTLYTNLMDASFNYGLPSRRNEYIWGVWGRYLRFHPNINFKFVYYYDLIDGDSSFYKQYPNKTLDEIVDRMVRLNSLPKSLFETPDEIRKIIDLSGEGKRLVMQLDYKGKKTFLRTYNDMTFWPFQSHFAAAFKRLTTDTTPSVLFTSRHFERSPYKLGEREYANHTINPLSRSALLNLGVDCDTIDLANKDIPLSTSALVVADPKSGFSTEEQQKIKSYLVKGGNAIFYGEPGKQQISNPMLESIGVSFEDGIIVSPNPHEMAHIVVDSFTDAAGHLADEALFYQYQMGKAELPPAGFAGTVNINYNSDSFSIKRLFNVADSDKAWIENERFVPDSAAPVFSAAAGDVKKELLTQGISVQRKINNKEQRIIIAGDADFMSAYRGSGGIVGNSLYSWVLNNEYPIYTNYPNPTDNLLTITRPQAKQLKIVFVYIVPAIFFVFAIIFLIRRKRK